MRKRSQKQTLIIVCVLAALVLALLAAGTILRMRSGSMGFAEAFAAFVSDTFRPYKNLK